MDSRASEDSVELVLIPHPTSGDQRHAHCPQTPTQKGDPFQLLLCKVATPTEHGGLDGKMLNEVKVCPGDMVGNDDCRLIFRQRVAGHGDLGAIHGSKDELDASPDEIGERRRDVVRGGWCNEGPREEKGEQEIGGQEMQQPRCDDDEAPQIGERGAQREGLKEKWHGHGDACMKKTDIRGDGELRRGESMEWTWGMERCVKPTSKS